LRNQQFGNEQHGVDISGGSNINIYDNYIHVENIGSVCNHSHDSVHITGKATRVMLQGNVIAYGHSNVTVWDASDISLVGNFLLNPRGTISCGNEANRRGNQFQAWSTDSNPNRNITILNNYSISSPDTSKWKFPGVQADAINFGVTNNILAVGKYVVGGEDSSSCGINVDYKGNNSQIRNNILKQFPLRHRGWQWSQRCQLQQGASAPAKFP
jgi:hypothetical protein